MCNLDNWPELMDYEPDEVIFDDDEGGDDGNSTDNS